VSLYTDRKKEKERKKAADEEDEETTLQQHSDEEEEGADGNFLDVIASTIPRIVAYLETKSTPK
jgi:hypothetical protein